MVPRFYEFTALRNGKTERKGVYICMRLIFGYSYVSIYEKLSEETTFLTYVHMFFTASGLKYTFAMVNEVDI